MKFVYRDYWNQEYSHRPYTNMLHDNNTDRGPEVGPPKAT